jgi:type II secretory pathway component PulF
LPKYRYVARNAQGQKVTADTESYDKNSLIQQLQRQGFFILSIEEETAVAAKPKAATVRLAKKKFNHGGIKLNDLITFSRQLTTMLESGVTLLRSLEVITAQVDSQKLYEILAKVTREVEQGSSLSEALAAHPKVFNQFWVSLIEVGEASGTMPTVLNKLAFYLEQQAMFRSSIVSAIVYPAVLFGVCMGAVTFFALFVGPRFEGIFNSMNVELPLITKVLLGTFRFIKQNFVLLLISGFVASFLFQKYIKTPIGKVQMESFMFSLPTFGNVYKMIVIERFTSQMSILIDSGVPILHALDISQRLVDNVTCARVVANIKDGVRQGELLVGPMERSGFFPPMTTQMITVGEETGELGKMLKHVAAFNQNTVETFMKRFGTLLEPFMLVFMGFIIGVIVLAMFLPLFNISQLGGGGGGK